jgi:hypothetical protein
MTASILVVALAAALGFCASRGAMAAGGGGAEHGHGHTHAHDMTGEIGKPVPEITVDATVEIEHTLTEGSAETFNVVLGSEVHFVLHAKTELELHLHGYDLSATTAPGVPAVFSFRAEHAGRFAIEAHGLQDVLGRTDQAVAYIEVRYE